MFGKQSWRLLTTVVAALALVIVGILVGLALVGNSALGSLPLVGDLFEESPTTTTTGPVTVGALRNLNELATVEREDYVIVTRESGGTELGRLFAGEEVGLVAVGTVRAGVDLDGLQQDDVSVDREAGTVTIDLPEAEILDVSLDEDQTRIFDRDLGPLNRGRNPDLGEEARDVAIDRLEASAEEGDILDQANTNAETALRTFIQTLGYDEVIFE